MYIVPSMFTDYSELMKIKIQEHNELYMINHYNIVELVNLFG